MIGSIYAMAPSPRASAPPGKSLATDEHGSIVAKLLLTSIES